eukprot:1186750-Prorocentrum_minimum.AAC.1
MASISDDLHLMQRLGDQSWYGLYMRELAENPNPEPIRPRKVLPEEKPQVFPEEEPYHIIETEYHEEAMPDEASPREYPTSPEKESSPFRAQSSPIRAPDFERSFSYTDPADNIRRRAYYENEEAHAEAEDRPLHTVQREVRISTRGPRRSSLHRVSVASLGDVGDSIASFTGMLNREELFEPEVSQIYADECRKMGINQLMSIKELLKRGDSELRVGQDRLSPGHGMAFARALYLLNNISVLDLSGNNFGDNVIDELTKSLMTKGGSGYGMSCPLQCLKLDSNQLKGPCMKSVAKLVESSGLQYLSLSNNPLLGNAVKPLLEVLVGDPELTGLDLTNTGMEDITAGSLSEAIARNTKLLHLYIGWNKLVHTWPRVSKSLCVNVHLQTLDVANNGSAGCIAMVSMLLRNEGLHTVDFSR